MLTEEIEKKIKKISKQTGKSPTKVLKESIDIYNEYLKLQKEFDLWDEISDNDFVKFEKKMEIDNGNIFSRNSKS